MLLLYRDRSVPVGRSIVYNIVAKQYCCPAVGKDWSVDLETRSGKPHNAMHSPSNTHVHACMLCVCACKCKCVHTCVCTPIHNVGPCTCHVSIHTTFQVTRGFIAKGQKVFSWGDKAPSIISLHNTLEGGHDPQDIFNSRFTSGTFLDEYLTTMNEYC